MLKKQIKLNACYEAKVSGRICTVFIMRPSPQGGWEARNLDTGRVIRIKSAQKLRREITNDE